MGAIRKAVTDLANAVTIAQAVSAMLGIGVLTLLGKWLEGWPWLASAELGTFGIAGLATLGAVVHHYAHTGGAAQSAPTTIAKTSPGALAVERLIAAEEELRIAQRERMEAEHSHREERRASAQEKATLEAAVKAKEEEVARARQAIDRYGETVDGWRELFEGANRGLDSARKTIGDIEGALSERSPLAALLLSQLAGEPARETEAGDSADEKVRKAKAIIAAYRFPPQELMLAKRLPVVGSGGILGRLARPEPPKVK